MRYGEWLSSGIHVIATNKRAGAGDADSYAAIQRAQKEHYTHFFAEASVATGATGATVGARPSSGVFRAC